MASAVDSRLAYARLSAVATASRLPTANRGSNNSYTTSWDTTDMGPDVNTLAPVWVVQMYQQKWSECADLNRGPPPPEDGALPG